MSQAARLKSWGASGTRWTRRVAALHPWKRSSASRSRVRRLKRCDSASINLTLTGPSLPGWW